jgi:hypothetical protein
MALATSYTVLILLPCLLIALAGLLPHSLTVGTFLAYAFALFPTYYLDHWLFGGIGYHSLVIFAVLAFVTAALLWPLPLLSARPQVWRSLPWRRAILGYGAVFLLFAMLAAWKMTQSGGLFFG